MSAAARSVERLTVSSWAPPVAACALLAAMLAAVVPPSAASLVQVAAVILLVGSVFAAVHHAELIALKVGEPFGTLVLALAVTVIECSLVVSLMLSGGESASALARDTVYATVMIVCNGVLGLCLFAGSLRHHVVSFRAEGTVPAVAVLATLATIGLTIPAVVVTSIVLDLPLVLGLPAKEMVLLALTLLLTSTTVASGRATVLQGIVHLVVFAVFLFLAMVP